MTHYLRSRKNKETREANSGNSLTSLLSISPILLNFSENVVENGLSWYDENVIYFTEISSNLTTSSSSYKKNKNKTKKITMNFAAVKHSAPQNQQSWRHKTEGFP